MMLSSVFTTRIRGFRVIDVSALAVLLALAFAVYGFKTFAGEKRADIADVESQIAQENKRIRLLHAEIAHLESPDRIERLSRQYLGLKPVSAAQEATPDALPQVAEAGPPPATAAKP